MNGDPYFDDGDILIYSHTGTFAIMELVRKNQPAKMAELLFDEEYVPDNKNSPLGDISGGAANAALLSDVADYLKRSPFRRAFNPVVADMVGYARKMTCSPKYERYTKYNDLALEHLRSEEEQNAKEENEKSN